MQVLQGNNVYKDGKKQEGAFTAFKFPEYTEIEIEILCKKHGVQKVKAQKTETGEIFADYCRLCEQEAYAEEERKEKERKEKERLEMYKAMNIEPEFYNKTLDDYIPQTEKQKEFKKAVENLIESKSGKLIVLGGNGLGKSMLGAMAVKSLGGVIYTMFQISLKIRSLDKKEMSEETFANSLVDAPFLVIDEIGRSKGSEFELNLLSYILDKRHTRNKPFMILSNTHFSRNCPKGDCGCEKCFERYFDNDLLSRFRQDGKFIELESNAPDWRDPRNKKLFGYAKNEQ